MRPNGTKELVSPPFEAILSGCSVQRAFALAESALAGREGPQFLARLHDSGLQGVSFRHITAEEAKATALELIKFGVRYPPPALTDSSDSTALTYLWLTRQP